MENHLEIEKGRINIFYIHKSYPSSIQIEYIAYQDACFGLNQHRRDCPCFVWTTGLFWGICLVPKGCFGASFFYIGFVVVSVFGLVRLWLDWLLVTDGFFYISSILLKISSSSSSSSSLTMNLSFGFSDFYLYTSISIFYSFYFLPLMSVSTYLGLINTWSYSGFWGL